MPKGQYPRKQPRAGKRALLSPRYTAEQKAAFGVRSWTREEIGARWPEGYDLVQAGLTRDNGGWDG